MFENGESELSEYGDKIGKTPAVILDFLPYSSAVTGGENCSED